MFSHRMTLISGPSWTVSIPFRITGVLTATTFGEWLVLWLFQSLSGITGVLTRQVSGLSACEKFQSFQGLRCSHLPLSRDFKCVCFNPFQDYGVLTSSQLSRSTMTKMFNPFQGLRVFPTLARNRSKRLFQSFRITGVLTRIDKRNKGWNG